MKYISQPVIKKDAYALLSGKPVYTDDLAPADCLVTKLLRSPHTHARIKSIGTSAARHIPGVETILTCKDVSASKFTLAGQTYPEPSPYDRLILDEVIWYVGDEIIIIAAKNEASALQVIKLIRIEYEVYNVVLDFTKALGHPVIVHAEEDYKLLCKIGNEWLRNLHSHDESIVGDVDQAFTECDVALEYEYHTKANAQATMETFRSYAYVDTFDRLNMVNSTQVPFHVRHMITSVLELPKSQIKVVKPRIGGGFGAKQIGYTEIFTAFVTWELKKPCKLVYTKEETFTTSSSRREMKIRMKIGAMKNGEVRAIDLYTLSNTGAYEERGSTTVGLSGHKPLPIYNHVKASRSASDVAYASTVTTGAYRGYGTTQGQFTVESTVNELADTLHIDPYELRLKNMVQEDEVIKQYYGEYLNSCALDRYLREAMDMVGWKERALYRDMGDKVRNLGIALSMRGSGIVNVDIASAVIKLQDDGFYTLSIGATDMDTGCDTILTQIAVECLDYDVGNIMTQSMDTGASPYDTGSYASVTTYVAGMAVVETCEKLKKQILHEAAVLLDVEEEHIIFGRSMLRAVEDDKGTILTRFADRCFTGGKGACLIASVSHCSPTSPSPFMAGVAEVDVDKLTGEITLVNYTAVMDCGTVINPNLARIQTEGGIAQGIGMALYKDITYSYKGRICNSSFLQYKIPSRQDTDTIRVDFKGSYEDNGPFRAKSIGEVVINIPAPATAPAVAHASGVQVHTLPITTGKILLKKDKS